MNPYDKWDAALQLNKLIQSEWQKEMDKYLIFSEQVLQEITDIGIKYQLPHRSSSTYKVSFVLLGESQLSTLTAYCAMAGWDVRIGRTFQDTKVWITKKVN